MLFNSFEFLLFFAIVTALYFAVPHRFRWFLLLTASCVFYMSFIPIYILILALLIVVDYFAGIFIEGSVGRVRKMLFLAASIFSTVVILFLFKYYNFFNSNLGHIANAIGWNYSIQTLAIVLPIGLSFHTFQSLSYVIEVYKGRQKAERNFGIYALYVMFYPQLVAGPIERPYNLLHQFYEEHKFEYARVVSGLKLMLLGFFKKMVIADRLAIFVNVIYARPTDYLGLPLILATVFFAFQIYCDFSGYSDIAIGVARVMGFKLMDNFKRPYRSTSIQEFWRRWHISLSSWFRDYIYIPLGGNRVSALRWYLNTMVVFFVCGLWHGANWTFVIWGVLHGGYMIASSVLAVPGRSLAKVSGLEKQRGFYDFFKVLITFSLVCFGWIFFRANSVSDALYIINHLFVGLSLSLPGINGVGVVWGFLALTSVVVLEWVHSLQEKDDIGVSLKQSVKFNWVAYAFSVVVILLFGVFEEVKFIYFQF